MNFTWFIFSYILPPTEEKRKQSHVDLQQAYYTTWKKRGWKAADSYSKTKNNA